MADHQFGLSLIDGGKARGVPSGKRGGGYFLQFGNRVMPAANELTLKFGIV